MIFEKQIVEMYKGMMHTRCDDDGTAFYFSRADFPGLIAEDYTFTSSLGHTMQGYFYYYTKPIDKRIIIFDHGFGGGHRSYMKEIERLCRHGFIVLAYDHTGCMESGGDTPRGMAQSLYDLNDCISRIKSDSRYSDFDISVMGHSWGGFSTLNISALHPEVSRVVVLSGFVSVEALVNSYFSGLLRGYRKPIMALERSVNPVFSEYDARVSLKKSGVPALLIYSDNDKMCKRCHFDMLSDALKECEGVELKLLHGKGHNPNYTTDAVKYLGEYFKTKKKLAKKKKLDTDEEKAAFISSFDWDKMTEQDEGVWAEILAFLDH